MTNKALPSIDFVCECFAFNPETGRLTWKARSLDNFESARTSAIWHRRFSGKDVGTPDSKGYLRIGLRYNGIRRAISVHRIAWAIHHGVWPDRLVDHINGDKTDNRIENLRLCSNAENMRNRGPTRANSLGVKGVYLSAAGNYRASIKDVSGRIVFLGTFRTLEQAKAAHTAAALRYHGAFANVG